MKLGKYIYQLILENETVIIPGFGAFLSDYQPAVIDFEADEVRPPSKKLSFTSRIRNNDGLLVHCVAENDGVSHFQALKTIEKERDKIMNSLDKGEKVRFENIGQLFLNDAREICFEPDTAENLLLDSFGLENTSLIAEPEKMAEPIEPEPLNASEAVHLKQESIDAETIPLIPKTDIYSEPVQSDIPEVKVIDGDNPLETEEILDPLKELITEPESLSNIESGLDKTVIEATEPVLEETIPVFSEPELKDEIVQKQVYYRQNNTRYNYETDHKNSRKWWLLLLLIPFAIGAYFLFRPKPISKPMAESITEQPKPETLLPADTLNTELAIVSKKDSAAQFAVQQPNELIKSPRYYIVGGGFSVEANAEKYIEKLAKHGIEGIRLGKKGKFYLVGIAAFDSEKDAYREMNALMRKNPDNELWVYKK